MPWKPSAFARTNVPWSVIGSTDIAMANRAGVVGVLVLSGEATEEDVAALPSDALQTPDIVVGSVDELLR